MGEQNNTQRLFTEIFPIKIDSMPTLYAYKIDTKGNTSTIGGKLAYRLKKTFAGHWAWANNLIVTDSPQEDEKIMDVVKALWSEQPDTFKYLHRVSRIHSWNPDAKAISEFVARGLISDVEKDIQNALSKNRQDLGKAFIERVYDVRGWVIVDQPAISISVSSRLVLKEDLKSYVSRVSQEEILQIGLQVVDKTSSTKGELTEFVGRMATERQRLLSLTKRDEMQKILTETPDDEWVVTISSGQNTYDYPVGSLRIILYLEYLSKFGIKGSDAIKKLKIEPQSRANIIKDISAIVTNTGYVKRAYSSDNNADLFSNHPNTSNIRLGNGKSIPYNEKSIINDLKNNRLFHISDKFKNGNPIRVGFISAIGEDVPYHEFWQQIESNLRILGFNVHKLTEVHIEEPSRVEIETSLSQLLENNPDIVIAFFPENYIDGDDDESAYYHFKSITVGNGIPSQVIEDTTIKNNYAVNNIVLGIVSKVGNVPYVLANPLEFADVIVGVDIARDKKKRLSGSINATAIARIYMNDGGFMQYVIHDAPLEGETIPTTVLQALFPKNMFEGKRVIIHRDGIFRGDEKQALINWAEKIKATFFLVEVIKTGSPRIYGISKDIEQPNKGSTFMISNHEALVVSSLPPFKDATPLPLRIRTQAPFTIEQAIESVLVMTNLHYGSVRPPRLPVTIHYSDKIAYMALRGIKPKNLEGSIPYWL